MKFDRRRTRPRIMVPIASMGDIAFLLIIFFILASTMKEKNVTSEPPVSPDIARLPSPLPPVSVMVDEEGIVFVDGDEMSVGIVESTVRGLLEGRKEREVMVRIDKKLKQKDYGPVLLALSKTDANMSLVGEIGESE